MANSLQGSDFCNLYSHDFSLYGEMTKKCYSFNEFTYLLQTYQAYYSTIAGFHRRTKLMFCGCFATPQYLIFIAFFIKNIIATFQHILVHFAVGRVNLMQVYSFYLSILSINFIVQGYTFAFYKFKEKSLFLIYDINIFMKQIII